MDPKPLEEEDMPKFEASHELEMKRKRHAERNRSRQEVGFTSSYRRCASSDVCNGESILQRSTMALS